MPSGAVMVSALAGPTSTSTSAEPRRSTEWKASTPRSSVRSGPPPAEQAARARTAIVAMARPAGSSQCVVHVLHVIVLLQFVQQRHDFRGLVFGQCGGRVAQELVRGGKRRDAALLQ